MKIIKQKNDRRTVHRASEPLFPLEENDHPNCHAEHQTDRERISKRPFELRIEVHPVNAGDKRQWNEDRRDHGQHSHDLICSDTDAQEIGVHDVARAFLECFEHVNHDHGVVVAVAKKRLSSCRNKTGFIPHQPTEHGPLRPNGPANPGD